MPPPSHGSDCVPRCWWTSCTYCQQRIYVFTCNHGSGVAFDIQGWPWPEHECGNPSTGSSPLNVPQVIRRTHADGSKVVEIEEWGITVIQPGNLDANDFFITPKRSHGQHLPKLDPVVAIPPGEDDSRQITGIIREVHVKVDHMKAFGYDDDGPMAVAMAQAILGQRWVREFGRITVHTPRIDGSQMESYTACIPASLVKDLRIKRGMMVSARITSVDVSDRYRDWYCDDLQTTH